MGARQRQRERTYTVEERTALVTEIERRHRAGEGTLRQIAAAAGITDYTYYNWIKGGIRPLHMRPVEVTAVVPTAPMAVEIAPAAAPPVPVPPAATSVTVQAAASPLVLVAPGGYRIEGLGVETAAQLLRALA